MRFSAEEPLRRSPPHDSIFLRASLKQDHFQFMRPPPLTPQPERHDLPRLAPECYRGCAVVYWTITLEHRAAGWLGEQFHSYFRELLLHAAAREHLFCPAYVLMPDHMHLMWMGLQTSSDQRNAMKFLRKHLTVELKRLSRIGAEFELQKQPYDSVLREEDRVRGAFAKACF
jgi:putative transposase